jgi:site-specific DNA recombinase
MYQQLTNNSLEGVKNCLLYARVSTDRQVKEGHSLEDQIQRLSKFARDKSWRILEVYKDGGKSGKSTAGRPEFNRMLDRCASDDDVQAVLLEETDRFARNAEDHLAVKTFLKKHNVLLITTEQPNFGDDPTGKFVDLIMAGANQLQREITGQKTKRTMVALAEKGIQPGAAVIGYLNSFKKGVPWLLDDERVPFVEEIFRLFKTGNYSVHTLEEMMYQQGLRTKNGKKVHSSQIHRMLTDVRYCGWVKYDGKIYKNGQHPKIVSISDIKQAEAIMKKHNNGADRSRKHNWFLAGLTHCKACGSLMSGEQHIKKSRHINRYYRCLGPKNYEQNCNQPYANMEDIHDQLTKWIASIQFDDRFYDELRQELRTLMNSQGTDVEGRLRSLKKRKDVIDRKMDKLEDQLLSEIIPQERLEKKYAPLREELKAVEAKIEKLSQPSANLDEDKIEKIITFMKRLPELYEAFTKTEKRQFLRWFAQKIWIEDKKVVEITYTEGFQALIDRDLVRISETWLPDLDSNQEPTAYT